MKTIRKPLWVLCTLLMVLILSAGAPKAETGAEGSDEAILVGRISHVQGQLLRYQPGDEGWAVTREDTPFGAGEALYTEGDSRAEIILPNGTWARLDGHTQVHLLELRDDLTDLDLGSGTGRFFSKGGDSLIKVRTGFGQVAAPAGTAFDLHVYANAVEVVGLQGRVSFLQGNTDQRFEVTAGSASIVASANAVSAGQGHADQGWAAWNRERDALWARRMASGEMSAAYLPPSLSDEAYVLDENGVWERAYYQDGYYDFWRPTHVGAGWSPFTVGCWETWYHESTWVPYEPFGYVTHHYGNWVFIGQTWYWAPPVARVRPRLARPLFDVGFAWVPGRVAWIQFGTNVGWVPLAPHEPYYAHRRWGRKAVVVRDAGVTHLNVTVTRYENHQHAVVIDHNDLHMVKDYRPIRIKGGERGPVATTYRVVPTLDRPPTKTSGGVRDGRRTERTELKPRPDPRGAEKGRQDRFEGVRGVNLQGAKTGQTSSTGFHSPAVKRPQTQPRNAAGGKTGSTRPIVTKSYPQMQPQTATVSKRGETPLSQVNRREPQKSIAPAQATATKAGLRRDPSRVLRTPGGLTVEQAQQRRLTVPSVTPDGTDRQRPAPGTERFQPSPRGTTNLGARTPFEGQRGRP